MDPVTAITHSLHGIALCALLVYLYFLARYFLHMFQLNSYTARVQWNWMRANKHHMILPFSLLVAALVCGFVSARDAAYAYGFFALLCLAAAALSLPKKAKKPLVFTARLCRLFVTLGLLMFLLLLLAALLGGTGEFVLFGIAAFVLPFLIPAANKINAPLEAAVRRHYTNDAKKILASCPNLQVIGITGSFGKTSVKYFLTHLLSVRYNTLMTPESYNTPMGVVKTIRQSLRATHEIFVCEMGAKYVGDIRELCDIVHPTRGIVTSIGEQHLESFGSVENIIKTKYELADALPPDGILYVNLSSETIAKNPPPRAAVTYGLRPDADYFAADIAVDTTGTTFTLVHGDERQKFSTKLIGAANVENIVGALAAANGYGIPLADLVPAVRTLRAVPHRMELLDRGAVTIIDDAFNSNPAGAAAALETLGRFDAMRIIVTPGMIELGDRTDALNAELGARAAAVCDCIVAVGEKQAKPILRGAREAGADEKNLYTAKNFADAMRYVSALDAGGRKKVVLLENDLPDNF